jgi:hypothetical protein
MCSAESSPFVLATGYFLNFTNQYFLEFLLIPADWKPSLGITLLLVMRKCKKVFNT